MCGRQHNAQRSAESGAICIINMFAAVKYYLGGLDKGKIIKLQEFLNSKTGFNHQHVVVNAALQLLHDVFGEKDCHARTAVGTNQLPMNAPVEIETIFEI